MKMNDGQKNVSSGGAPGERDPLAEILGKEAMAERIPFSPELHHRILKQIREEAQKPLPSRRSWRSPSFAAAAAVILITSIGLATWMLRSKHRPMLQSSTTHLKKRESPQLPDSIDFRVEAPGILSANLWPPEIRIDASVFAAPPQTPTSYNEGYVKLIVPPPQTPFIEFPASPEWLLAHLQAPTTSANEVLLDVIPPELNDLFRLLTGNDERGK
jgi:hypothetical protein